MDYVGILKKAWSVTWRYKILWLFGFFAGAGGGFGGGNGGSGYSRAGSSASQPLDAAQVQRFLSQYLGLIVLGVVVLVLIGLVMLVIGIAARGGLIHLVNEAEEGRAVRAGEGWRVGFSKWGRVFGVGFLAALPGLIVALIVAVIAGVAVAGAISSGGSAQNMWAAVGGVVIGGLCLVLVLGVIAVVLGVILGIVAELAVRYVVLRDMRVLDSMRQGWRDLFGKRGAFLMFLVQIAVGIVFGLAVGIVLAILAIPGVLAFMAGAWPIGALMVLIGVLVLIVPVAVYGTFYHAVWTIFFRRMTGMEPAPVAVAPVGPAGYPGAFPPAPPVMQAQAPPFTPEPPAPPAPPLAPESVVPVASPTPPGPPDA